MSSVARVSSWSTIGRAGPSVSASSPAVGRSRSMVGVAPRPSRVRAGATLVAVRSVGVAASVKLGQRAQRLVQRAGCAAQLARERAQLDRGRPDVAERCRAARAARRARAGSCSPSSRRFCATVSSALDASSISSPMSSRLALTVAVIASPFAIIRSSVSFSTPPRRRAGARARCGRHRGEHPVEVVAATVEAHPDLVDQDPQTRARLGVEHVEDVVELDGDRRALHAGSSMPERFGRADVAGAELGVALAQQVGRPDRHARAGADRGRVVVERQMRDRRVALGDLDPDDLAARDAGDLDRRVLAQAADVAELRMDHVAVGTAEDPRDRGGDGGHRGDRDEGRAPSSGWCSGSLDGSSPSGVMPHSGMNHGWPTSAPAAAGTRTACR